MAKNSTAFNHDYARKKITFVGRAAHAGVCSDHCRALIATYFWQNPDAGSTLAQRKLSGTELEMLRDPNLWVRRKKRTNIDHMRRDLPNHEAIVKQHGKIEEREFKNKGVTGFYCHIYSAGDEMLKFTAFPEDAA